MHIRYTDEIYNDRRKPTPSMTSYRYLISLPYYTEIPSRSEGNNSYISKVLQN